MEEGNVHSNILSGAYTLSVSLTSISGSGSIWCREDAAALISDVLLLLPLFLHSTWQGHAANYWAKGDTSEVVYELRVKNNS